MTRAALTSGVNRAVFPRKANERGMALVGPFKDGVSAWQINFWHAIVPVSVGLRVQYASKNRRAFAAGTSHRVVSLPTLIETKDLHKDDFGRAAADARARQLSPALKRLSKKPQT